MFFSQPVPRCRLPPASWLKPAAFMSPCVTWAGRQVDPSAHDGQLRPAVGVESFQVMRANRTHPELADNFGWTYNHAPMIVYWNGRFYVEYLSNPVGEHIAPGQTLLCTSVRRPPLGLSQGRLPDLRAAAARPAGEGDDAPADGLLHRPDGRLLVMAFYGHAPDPFGTGGIGRVVREIYKDGTLRPDLFLALQHALRLGREQHRLSVLQAFDRTPASSRPATRCSPIA